MTSSATPDLDLRRLLSRSGSYPVIAAAVATGRLPQLPVRLFEHVGDVYRRVETAADDDFTGIAALRLAALVHEEPPESLSRLLASTGVSDLTPIVLAVIGGFGRIWKIRPADDLHAYVEASRPYLASVLLFEVAHEGRATVSMERAADLGALRPALTRWTARLARPNRCAAGAHVSQPRVLASQPWTRRSCGTFPSRTSARRPAGRSTTSGSRTGGRCSAPTT